MKQTTRTIWDDAIREYEEYGFRIDLSEALLLELYFKDKKIETFHRNLVTPSTVANCCKNYFKDINGDYDD